MSFYPLKFAKANSKESVTKFFNLAEDVNPSIEELEKLAASDEFLRKSYSGSLSGINTYALENKEQFMQFFNANSFKQYRTEMRDMIMIGVIGEKWNKYKQVYRVDPDFLVELCDTDNVKIPLRVFTEQPYPCFYVDVSSTNALAPFIGFFVNVSIDTKTGLPNLTFLRIAKQKDVEEELIYSAYFLAKDLLYYNMVKVEKGEVFICIDRSHIMANSERKADPISNAQGARPFIEDVQTFIIFSFQFLQFLGSEKPDVVVTSTSSNKKTTGTAKKVQESKVGFRYGAAIRSYNKRYVVSSGKARSEDNEDKKHRAAHIRRAHWQVYWTGKGRKIPVTKWVAPFMAGGKDVNLDVTVHTVKP